MDSSEIEQIQKTWEPVQQTPTDSGVAILTTFFTRYPSNLQKFASFKDMSIPELKDNLRFKTHAKRIIYVFDESVEMLGRENGRMKLEELWSEIAESHFKRQIRKEAFNELKEIILEVLTNICKLDEKQQATWTKLLNIVYEMLFKALSKLEEDVKPVEGESKQSA